LSTHKNNPTLDRVIAEGKLFTIADDVLVNSHVKDEASHMINSLEAYGDNFLLKFDKLIANFFNDHEDFKQEKQFRGHQDIIEGQVIRAENLPLQEKCILIDAKNDVNRNLEKIIVSTKIYNLKTQLFTSYVRGLVIYYIITLFAGNIIACLEIQDYEFLKKENHYWTTK
jgi:hypothetical protein